MNYTEDESFAELFEDFDSDDRAENDESDEARKRFRPISPRVVSGAGLYKARPASTHVTQMQLQAALARVGGQIRVNADATKAVGRRVNAVGSRVDGEIAARKKETAAIKKELESARSMGILPLLLTSQPKFEKATVDDKGAITDITFKKTDNLLPLILLMGMGGTGGMGGSGGSDNNMMLMMVLLLSQK